MKTTDMVEAIVKGVISIPVDLYLGVRRTVEDSGLAGRQTQFENQTERERLFKLFKEALRNRSILANLINIILDSFLDVLPESTLKKMQEKASLGALRYSGKYAAKTYLVNLMSRKLVESAIAKASLQRFAKLGVGLVVSTVLMQGLMEHASEASKRLRRANPEIYRKLQEKNLDLLYFLVEDFTQPFLEAIKLADKNQYEFQKALGAIEKKLE